MIDLLGKFLEKIGAKSYLDLNDEERETYKMWEAALAGRRLTDQDVAVFLQQEKESALAKLTTQKLSEREDIFLKMELNFIKKLQMFLNTPKVEQAFVEAQIKQQIS